MGLDACVYCDCYEKGRLRTLPLDGVSLYVTPYGALECDSKHMSIDAVLAFDQWQAFSACEHEESVLLHHYLGNISLVALLRSELQREPSRFPVLLTKVVYSGAHCGDYLTFETIPPLQRELESLADFECSTREADEFMAQFRTQMSELATTALSVAKPIAF
jgi:hypothetical protein